MWLAKPKIELPGDEDWAKNYFVGHMDNWLHSSSMCVLPGRPFRPQSWPSFQAPLQTSWPSFQASSIAILAGPQTWPSFQASMDVGLESTASGYMQL